MDQPIFEYLPLSWYGGALLIIGTPVHYLQEAMNVQWCMAESA